MKPELPDPKTAPELFEGVLQRRMLAYVIDFAILMFLCGFVLLLGLIAGFLSFGLSWVLLPIVLPLVVAAYYAATLGSPARATIGMQQLDLVLTPVRGQPLDGWKILIHPLIFWITVWIAWPISFAIALLTPRREMVHDLITGTLMLRRSPMERHWRAAAQA